MADDETSQRDELDAALTARLRAVRPSMPLSPTPASTSRRTTSSCATSTARWTTASASVRGASGRSPERRRPRRHRRRGAGRRWLGPAGQAGAGRPARRTARLALRLPLQRGRPQLLARHRPAARPRASDGGAVDCRSGAPAEPQSFFEFVSQYPFESGEVDARLALEPVARQAIDVQLEVTQGGAPLEGVRVKLLRDGRPVDSAPTEKGRCTFSGLLRRALRARNSQGRDRSRPHGPRHPRRRHRLAAPPRPRRPIA